MAKMTTTKKRDGGTVYQQLLIEAKLKMEVSGRSP
jgi:hypothetical protein